MTVDVFCVCGKRFAVDARHVGKRIRCPGCHNPVLVPPPSPSPGAPGPDPEPASYGVVVAFAWLYFGLAALWLLAAIIATGYQDVPAFLGVVPAAGAFVSAVILAPWTFLAVDAARTLRAILEEIRRK